MFPHDDCKIWMKIFQKMLPVTGEDIRRKHYIISTAVELLSRFPGLVPEINTVHLTYLFRIRDYNVLDSYIPRLESEHSFH